jgi:predicted O-methyltransferase YrrM
MESTKESESFIMSLTGTGAAEVEGYLAEIGEDQRFHSSMKEKRNVSGGGGWGWGFSVGKMLGEVLYAICRRRNAGIVVETGVASGVSSSYILCALGRNEHGELYSIDQPWGRAESGWLIPDYLRPRWHLVQGQSSDELPPLLKRVGEIDIFLHDSQHSYQNMRWEYQTAWAHLRVGGILLSHNIDSNRAFPDFCREHRVTGYSLDNLGGVVKSKPAG